MIALRILGRGNFVDDVSEMSSVARSSVLDIFKQFVRRFSKHNMEFIRFHQEERLKTSMSVYSNLGFPGAVGSMDATHVRLWKCPDMFQNRCEGKEGYPTLGWMCVVDHFKFIQYVSDAYFGAANDKQMCNVDPFCMAIQGGSLRNVPFNIINERGERQRCKGAYVIVDGGMTKKACFVDPMHERVTYEAVHWSEWAESIRKDVECTFGVLKQRFLILKHGVWYRNFDDVHGIFLSCCMLHNMLLVWDGRSVEEMMTEEYWERNPPDAEDIDEDYALQYDIYRSRDRFTMVEDVLGTLAFADAPLIQFRSLSDYKVIREMLITSFSMQLGGRILQ